MTRQSPITTRLVDIDAVPTRILEVEGHGPSILLLHGFTDSADSWRPLLKELAAAGRHAVAVDLPGAGHAPALGRPPLPVLDTFVRAFVRAHAGERGAILVGNSLGGLVALRAATTPELPLVAVAGLGPAGLAYHPRLEAISRLAAWLDPLLRVFDWVPVPVSALRRAVGALYDRRLARGRAEAELGRLYASHIDGLHDLGRLRRDLVALTASDSILDPATLRQVRVPVLLAWGDRDQLANIEGAPILLDAVTDSRLVVIEDCGHCPHVEFPAAIADLLLALPTSAMPDPEGGRSAAGPGEEAR